MPRKPCHAQAYIDIASNLSIVAVFGAAISFGTLVTLPIGTPNSQNISKLLALASYLFTACLFATIGIAYLLRNDERDKPLPVAKERYCQMHVWLVILLVLAGFIVVNVVMMNFGERAIGIAGIVSLGVAVPTWFLVLMYLENTGKLDHKTSTPMIEN
jgi:hypothetical protein